MLQLIQAVRSALEDFIDLKTGRLGHAFPIDNNGMIRTSGGERGIAHQEFESTPENFSESLLRASTIIGVDEATKLLSDWKHGEPIRFKTSTILNGLVLDNRHCPRDDIEIAPLPLTTSELPRLLFLWTEQAEAAPLSLNDWGAMGDDNLDHFWWKSKSLNSHTGTVSIEHMDDASIARLDETELLNVIQALLGSDRKLRIAVDRWKRSMRPYTPVADRYIDLRIALETLYLKDFLNENSAEMRFRLSLFGAWHLGKTLEKHREIRKVLRDAYDKASGAVHGGEVSDDGSSTLPRAQKLCRQGILKLLQEAPPDDWGDMILGAGH